MLTVDRNVDCNRLGDRVIGSIGFDRLVIDRSINSIGLLASSSVAGRLINRVIDSTPLLLPGRLINRVIDSTLLLLLVTTNASVDCNQIDGLELDDPWLSVLAPVTD